MKKYDTSMYRSSDVAIPLTHTNISTTTVQKSDLADDQLKNLWELRMLVNAGSLISTTGTNNASVESTRKRSKTSDHAKQVTVVLHTCHEVQKILS